MCTQSIVHCSTTTNTEASRWSVYASFVVVKITVSVRAHVTWANGEIDKNEKNKNLQFVVVRDFLFLFFSFYWINILQPNNNNSGLHVHLHLRRHIVVTKQLKMSKIFHCKEFHGK